MDAEEKRVYTLILILIIVLGTIITYFLASFISQQRNILRLKRLNAIAELNALEKERARIAADLHDEVAPLLSTIKLKVSSFELHNRDDQIQQKKTDQHLKDVLSKMREISFNLMPVTLSRKGLHPALQELKNNLSHKTRLNIELDAQDVALSDIYSTHIYRIIQEIVHNTIKHSDATTLQIDLKRENNNIILSTKDNGKGFDCQNQLENGKGFGLRSLLSRTDLLGGELFIESKTGVGTVYTIEIPLT